MFKNHKTIIMVIIDSIIIGLSFLTAYFIRFEGRVTEFFLQHAVYAFPVFLAGNVAFLIGFNVYRSFREYISIEVLYAIIKAITLNFVVVYVVIKIFTGIKVPNSIFIIHWLLLLLMLSGIRITYRFLSDMESRQAAPHMKRVLIVGAGHAGEMIIRQMLRNRDLGYLPIGLFDDDPKKLKMKIHNVPVLGGTEKMEQFARSQRADEIIISVPSATNEQMSKIIRDCEKCDIPFKSLPSLKEMINGKVKVQQIRKVKIDDLLGRSPVKTDVSGLASLIQGKVVFVTGAAGSIGSELCKQILRFKPAKLIMYDKSENEMFRLENQLKLLAGACEIYPMVANILDHAKLLWSLNQFQPQVLFHAAAHKHVPLMEVNPEEAIKNNTLGTIKVALAASEAGVNKFIFISTDKAVSPTSIMGASKRLAELFLQKHFYYHQQKDQSKFIIVRFGNVLGSNGSVIPIFQQQIEAGGPVKVTHKEMTRFFMTIEEAVQLILQAAMLGKGGEIFILDMGQPIKIIDLAKHLISFYGYKPERDIQIEFMGIRPGEKMHEKLWYDNENPQYVVNRKLYMARPPLLSQDGLYESLNILKKCAIEVDRIHLIENIMQLIPDYVPYSEWVQKNREISFQVAES